MKLKQLIFSVCLTLPIAIPATAGGGVGTVDQLLVGRNGHEVLAALSLTSRAALATPVDLISLFH